LYERVSEHKKSSAENIQSVLKDPYIFEFLGLKADEQFSEKEIETAIIDHIQKFYWNSEKDLPLLPGNSISLPILQISILIWFFTIIY
jgi:hypothetical protein